MTLRIAVDTGGTFTDLVLIDEANGRLLLHKVASTPDNPGRALVQGVTEIIHKAGRDSKSVEVLVHGTTVATNTVLQRRGAKVALVTTAGFRDVLHIQRQDRPRLYDLRSRRAAPLIPRSLRLELDERIRFDGSVQTPVDPDELRRLIDQLKAQGVQAVAVGLLHSYANPDHERAVGRALAEHLSETTVCLSHELVQEEGEYERFSTCAMNAYVQPAMKRYLDEMVGALEQAGVRAPLFVMKSNGGVMSAAVAARQCVHTILSGPAGGAVAGAGIAAAGTRQNVITADMGGTSFDVAMIHEGKIAFARDAEMAGLALKVPMLDIHTVGAGGGSVGWIDPGGSLRVGPESAGAVPGPACYGKGGRQPTVTDANLVLGRLGSDSLLGGGMRLDIEAARRVICDRLAKPLNMRIEQAAEGMIRVVNATMNAAIRKLTVERGYDPRTFTLCAFGGAGPMHGVELAAELGARELLVPVAPGVTSAVGLLMSRLREDRVRTAVGLLSEFDPRRLEKIMDDLRRDAQSELAFASKGRALETTRTLGLRYLGQGYDLPVKIEDGPLDAAEITDAFHEAHHRRYGFARQDQPVELVNVWVSVEVDVGTIALPPCSDGSEVPPPLSTRSVYFAGRAYDTPVFRREELAVGAKLQGPAIIQQLDTTTVLWPRQQLEVDPIGQLVLGPIHVDPAHP